MIQYFSASLAGEVIDYVLLFRIEICMFAIAALVYVLSIGHEAAPRTKQKDSVTKADPNCEDVVSEARDGDGAHSHADAKPRVRLVSLEPDDRVTLPSPWHSKIVLLVTRARSTALARVGVLFVCVCVPIVAAIRMLIATSSRNTSLSLDVVQLQPVALTPTPAFVNDGALDDFSLGRTEPHSEAPCDAGDDVAAFGPCDSSASPNVAVDDAQSVAFSGAPSTNEAVQKAEQLLQEVEGLVMRCGTVAADMERLRLGTAVPDAQTMASATVAFETLRRLEDPFRHAFTKLSSVAEFTQSLSRKDDSQQFPSLLDDALSMRSAARDCLLGAVRRAHALSTHAMLAVQSEGKPFACARGSLQSLERLALREALQEEDVDMLSVLALYWSEAAISGAKVPCFTDSLSNGHFVRDARGFFVPKGIAKAEELLARAEIESFEDYQAERAAARASRLYEHASYLEMEQLDAAAEWRYRDASSLGALHHRPDLAAHSLARLSAMLMFKSRQKDALAAANAALTHGNDPLALYLQTSLRLGLGHYHTGVELREAAQQLKGLAGQLPWEDLEAQRSAWQAELGLWDAIATGGLRACLALGDAAKVMICVLGRLTF